MNKNPTRTLQATWLAMLALQTIGTIDTKHKMPAPKQYVAIGVLWGILFLLADTGLAKLASRLSLLVLLAAMVLGPFGKRLVKLLDLISKNFATPPPPPTATGPGGTTTFGGAGRPARLTTPTIPRGFAPGPVAPTQTA